MSSFYSSKSDLALAQRVMLNSPDVYVNKIEHEQDGALLDLTVPAVATFATTGFTFADDDFISAAFENLFFIDDVGELCKVKIDDSLSSGGLITFDSTAAVLVNDETSSAALTDAKTYQMRVVEASPNALVGSFIGDTSDYAFNYELNEAELKVGIPKKLRAKGVVEVVMSLSFNYAQITDPKILISGLRGETRGDQTAQTQVHYGFEPNTADKYMIQGLSTDQIGRNFFFEAFYCELSISELTFGGDEYKQLGVSASMLADPMRPDKYNAFRTISLD